MWKKVKSSSKEIETLDKSVVFQFGLTSNESRSISATVSSRCLFISLPDWLIQVNLREIVLAVMEFTDSVLTDDGVDRIIFTGQIDAALVRSLRFLGMRFDIFMSFQVLG
jgi:hypothetical protein